MSELWETLTTGLVLSLLFIGVSYLFWKRYDKPTPLMIERQEERDRLKEERKTWREVEARLRAEQDEAELKAAYERRKAEERTPSSLLPPKSRTPWKSLGVSAPAESTTFEAKGRTPTLTFDRSTKHRSAKRWRATTTCSTPQTPSRFVKTGVQLGAEEPDWELIEKLEEIASKDEIVVPDVPEAPDLDAAIAQTPREETDAIAPNASDVDGLSTTARDPTVASSSEGAQNPRGTSPRARTFGAELHGKKSSVNGHGGSVMKRRGLEALNRTVGTMVQRPRGTRDFTPAPMRRRLALEHLLEEVAQRHGFSRVQTPIFESLELFTAKSGPGVINQLYALQDKGERDLTLRPELTAPVMRMVAEEMRMDTKPLRLSYYGQCYRYEEFKTGVIENSSSTAWNSSGPQDRWPKPKCWPWQSTCSTPPALRAGRFASATWACSRTR